MLKKAGILVAVAAAGVLAVAPLAFAGEPTHHDHTTTSYSPSCSFKNSSHAGNKQSATGSNALLGLLGTAANAAAPVTTQANAPVGSCNNVSDVIDSGSNNKTKTIDNSKTVNNSKTVTTSSTSTITSFFSSILG